MARVELHRGEDVVIVDADADLDAVVTYARDLLTVVSPPPVSLGPAVGFVAERRGEVDLETLPIVTVRSEHG